MTGKFSGGTLVEHFFFYDHSASTSTVFGVGTVSPRGSIVGSGFRRVAINDDGIIVGTAVFAGGPAESRGFIYDGPSFTDLGTMPGATATGIRPAPDALDINRSGLVTGTANSGAGTIPSEGDNIDVYLAGGAPLTDLDGDTTTATRGEFGRTVNDAGRVVGQNSEGKAASFSGATEVVLLSATSHAADGAVAYDLNESGQVLIENSTDASALIFDTINSSLTVIPQIGTGNRMFPKAINEDGDAVGQGDRTPGTSGEARGFVYLDDDAISYIPEDHTIFTGSDTPGLSDWERLRTAWGINNEGYIVGQGDRRFDGSTFPNERAYLLPPVPEPSSLALLATVACLLGVRWIGRAATIVEMSSC